MVPEHGRGHGKRKPPSQATLPPGKAFRPHGIGPLEALPITSAVVESLIKQFNQRVKGTEKFWTQDGAEAVLQIRAAYLSEDDRAARFHEQRPRGRAAGRNRKKLAA